MRFLTTWPLQRGDGEKAFTSVALGTRAEEKALGTVGLRDLVFTFPPLDGEPILPDIALPHHTSPEWLGVRMEGAACETQTRCPVYLPAQDTEQEPGWNRVRNRTQPRGQGPRGTRSQADLCKSSDTSMESPQNTPDATSCLRGHRGKSLMRE